MIAVRALAILAVVWVTAGCYRGPGVASPMEGHAFPEGVAASPVPSGFLKSDRWSSCCWIGRVAAFTTPLDHGARALRFVVYLPNGGPYDERPERLDIAVNGAPPRTFAGLRAGIYDLVVPLPPGAHATASVRMQAAYVYGRTTNAAGRTVRALRRGGPASVVLKGALSEPSADRR